MDDVSLRSEYFDVDGHRLHARVARHGDAGAPTVVLVHGLLVSSRYMIPLVRELARDFTVLAVDLPGFGRSSRPPVALRTPQLGAVFARFLQQATSGKSLVVANSYGCHIVTEAAVDRPDLFSGLVFMGAVDLRQKSAMRHALRMARSLPFEPWWFVPVALRDLASCGVRAVFHWLGELTNHDMRARLDALIVPVFVLRGKHDYVSPAHWVEELALHVRSTPVLFIDKSGHIAHGRRPRAVADAVRKVMFELIRRSETEARPTE